VNPIADNLREIEDRILRAEQRAGRVEGATRLVAVSKLQPLSLVEQAVQAGVRELAENYVQEAEKKFAHFEGRGVTRHLIGRLQRNKAARAVACCDLIQSLDGEAVSAALSRHAVEAQRELEVLIQVNLSGEERKSGIEADALDGLVEMVRELPGLALTGLMGLGPAGAPEQVTAACFGRLRAMWEGLPAENRQVLSMGMSGDFELAIAEGATMVRVGGALFGARGAAG